MSVDGALGNTGVAILKDGEPIYIGRIKTTKNKKTQYESERILHIYGELSKLIGEFQPNIVVVENQYASRLNAKTSLSLARIRGVIQLLCAQHHLPCYALEPKQIKKTVAGSGNADKKAIHDKIIDLFKEYKIVQESIGKFHDKGKEKNDDISDALAIAYAYIQDPNQAIRI